MTERDDDKRMLPACMDCGLPYEQFPLDLLFPRSQWCEILSQTRENPCADDNDGGLLCAQCMIKRAAKVPGATCVQAVIEINPHQLTPEELASFRQGIEDIKHGRFKSLDQIDSEMKSHAD